MYSEDFIDVNNILLFVPVCFFWVFLWIFLVWVDRLFQDMVSWYHPIHKLFLFKKCFPSLWWSGLCSFYTYWVCSYWSQDVPRVMASAVPSPCLLAFRYISFPKRDFRSGEKLVSLSDAADIDLLLNKKYLDFCFCLTEERRRDIH